MSTGNPGLKSELQYYSANKQSWLADYAGHFVVIKGAEVLNFFPSFESAYRAGAAKWGSDADFLVKRVAEHDPVFCVFWVPSYRLPIPNAEDLEHWGPRIEITLGPPIVRPSRVSFPDTHTSGQRFSTMPALIDTGAGRTLVTSEAIAKTGLRQVDETKLLRVGGVSEHAGIFAASIQFGREKLSTIEIIQVVCCDLPEQPIQCLLGRDVLARWRFVYDGRIFTCTIEEEDVAAWVEPPFYSET